MDEIKSITTSFIEFRAAKCLQKRGSAELPRSKVKLKLKGRSYKNVFEVKNMLPFKKEDEGIAIKTKKNT